MSYIDENDINENQLIALTHSANDFLEIKSIKIDKSFTSLITGITHLCEDESSSLAEIILFLENTEVLEALNNTYRYCTDISGAFQGFTANHQKFIKEIKNRSNQIFYYKTMQQKLKNNVISLNEEAKRIIEGYDCEHKTNHLKYEIKNQYHLWHEAYSIQNTYDECNKESDILAYSHRICGWSEPVYSLTPNFSIELKTNFGYGSSSYFYLIMTYKSLQIVPFSEWTTYRHIKASDIIRYSRKFELENNRWLDVMEYTKDACNLAMRDEETFIKEYIFNDCKKMIHDLEELVLTDDFEFVGDDMSDGDNEYIDYDQELTAHRLLEVKGEKVSGGLSFISNILELNSVFSTTEFIKRIEELSYYILPKLDKESQVIGHRIVTTQNELDGLVDDYEKLKNDMLQSIYRDQHNKFSVKDKEEVATLERAKKDILKDRFYFQYDQPKELSEFIKYKRLLYQYVTINMLVISLKKIKNNLLDYQKTIQNYFASK